MKTQLTSDPAYKDWISEIKKRIQSGQIRASLAVNQELISLYWDLGKVIVEKQKVTNWGDGRVDQVAKSLKLELPGLAGFSREYLYYMKRFYLAYNQETTIVEQVVP